MIGYRVYLAGRFSRRDEFNDYARQLRLRNFTVDARWLVEKHEWYGEDSDAAIAAAEQFARDDVEDVLRSDFVLVFTERPNPGGRNRGGRHVEYGIAVGQGKDIVVIGDPENVFHTLRGSIGLPDGTIHGTTARILHARTFEEAMSATGWLTHFVPALHPETTETGS